MISIQDENLHQIEEIRKVNVAAFGDNMAANLIDSLRANKKVYLSLIAEMEGRVVGHILFSPVFIEGCIVPLRGSALAPVAVLPEYQKRGIGSALINESLKRARELGIDYVILLGHTTYYPRFGFVPVSNYGLTSSYGNGEHVMIQELTADTLKTISGKICFQPEFRENGC